MDQSVRRKTTDVRYEHTDLCVPRTWAVAVLGVAAGPDSMLSKMSCTVLEVLPAIVVRVGVDEGRNNTRARRSGWLSDWEYSLWRRSSFKVLEAEEDTTFRGKATDFRSHVNV